MTMRFRPFFLFSGIILLLFLGCVSEKSIRIALSKSGTNYVRWIRQADSTIEIIDLNNMGSDSAKHIMMNCSGLLLTGGEDVHPALYGHEFDTAVCTGFNRHRDSLEIQLIDWALQLKIPVLGICRGCQIVNIYLHGTLLADLSRDMGNTVAHQCPDYTKCFHPVYIQPTSLFRQITGVDSGMVNTNHHQAVGLISPLLMPGAQGSDGVVEEIEWLNPEGKEFLLGVQWHPERMDFANPLSGLVLNEFIKECRNYKSQHKLQ